MYLLPFYRWCTYQLHFSSCSCTCLEALLLSLFCFPAGSFKFTATYMLSHGLARTSHKDNEPLGAQNYLIILHALSFMKSSTKDRGDTLSFDPALLFHIERKYYSLLLSDKNTMCHRVVTFKEAVSRKLIIVLHLVHNSLKKITAHSIVEL